MNAVRQTVAMACLLLALAACGPSGATTTADPAVNSGLIQIAEDVKAGLMPQGYAADPAYGFYVTWDAKPVLVIWSDAPSCNGGAGWGSHSSTTPGGTLTYRGTDHQLNREIKFSGTIQARDKGQLTIDGATYDLANGAMFLVSVVRGTVLVKQMSTDVSKLNLEPHALVAFGKADPEITAFFSTSPTPK